MFLQAIDKAAFFWVLQGICTLHRKPYSAQLSEQQIAAPYDTAALEHALRLLRLDTGIATVKPGRLMRESFPLVAAMRGRDDQASDSPALVLQADAANVLVVEVDDQAPVTMSLEQFASRYLGHIMRVSPQAEPLGDRDATEQVRQARTFGFKWFVPELLKHKTLWQEVLLASLVIQLIALATPLFTQSINYTQSTLIVIVIGMAVFMVFSSALSWLRQYLVLHTGNRVDAALGSAVFTHLFELPPMYFMHRPTGVIAARLHGVETIRELIAGAAVTLMLDLPFLLIFVAIMFYYSVTLTLIVLAIVLAIMIVHSVTL
jgi:subfamily B ATP-binding cassette protein HlyB/CyaB